MDMSRHTPPPVSPRPIACEEHDDYRLRYERLLLERGQEMREAAARVRQEAEERRRAEGEAQASQERFRILVEHSRDLILIVDANARVTYCSPSVQELVGYRQDEIIGRIADQFIDAEDLRAVAALRASRDAAQASARGRGTLRVRTRDGSLRWFEWTASSHLDDEAINGIVINARDVTASVVAERRLRASEERYRLLAESSPDMIYMIGADCRVSYLNERAAQILGATPDELVDQPLQDLFTSEAGDRIWASVQRVLTSGEDYEGESLITYPRGELWMRTHLAAVRDEAGVVTGVLGVSHDITHHHEAREALAESERHYRSLFEDSPVPLWLEDHSAVKPRLEQLLRAGITDLESHLRAHPDETLRLQSLIRAVNVNRAAAELCRAASPQEVIDGEKTLYPPGCPGGIPSFWAAAMAGRRTAHLAEVDASSPTRPLRLMETYIIAPGHEDSFDQVYVADVEVTERRRTEELLARYRLLFAEARDIMWFVRSGDGRIVEANAAAEVAYGYSRDELLELTIADLRADEDGPLLAEQMRQAAAGGVLFETEHRRKDGTLIPVEVSSRGIVTLDGETLLLSVIRDVTERKKTQDELARAAERLERTLQAVVAALSGTAELRDPYTAGHQRRVAELACAIAAKLDWGPERIAALRTAALLHDLGKMIVPAEILSKPGRLTDAEFSLIREHAAAGAEIVADIDFGDDIAAIVRQHHERLDGSGYPLGLSGADILPEAKVLAVADVVEAMISHRPYRAALSQSEALDELRAGAGRRYDEQAAAACIELLEVERLVLP
jgi:PAS domain S-box-containing protein/putative nucleotidyltransferase with HDIG domain